MSHLGDLLSALVDGELSGTELDRANAHLAACEVCQAEASSLRRLKQDLRALAASCDADGITGRLLAMTGDDGLAARLSARSAEPGSARPPLLPRPRQQAGQDPARPRSGRPRTGVPRRRRGRYVLWATVSLVVVGTGTAAFGMGGGGGSTGPRITPQVEVFDVEHAASSGDVPFAGPVSTRLPEVAGKP
jgi:anti-sigma factor RsiW